MLVSKHCWCFSKYISLIVLQNTQILHKIPSQMEVAPQRAQKCMDPTKVFLKHECQGQQMLQTIGLMVCCLVKRVPFCEMV